MNEKSTRRRHQSDNKRLLDTKTEETNEKIAAAVKKRRQHRRSSSCFEYLLMRIKYPMRILIYFVIMLLVPFSLYKILIGFIDVEYTNIPINLPKLVNVNDVVPERFWGTYR